MAQEVAVVDLSEEQIRWFRQVRSGLAAPAYADPETAAVALAGVQAQILSASAIAIWNRVAAGADTYLEFAHRLHERRTLIRLWGQRHTLHLFASADWPLLYAAFADRRTWWEREAAKPGSGIDLGEYRAAVHRVGEVLRERGTLGRSDLRRLPFILPEGLMSPWGGVFAELVRAGQAVHARWEDGEARYAHREHWLPTLDWAPPTALQANVELARRYFAVYGPSTINDLAYWRGGTARAARTWGAALGAAVSAIDAAGRLALTADLPLLAAEPPPRGDWPVRMLGRFDPILLGHREKDWIVPAKYYDRVWRPAGHIEGIVLEHGRAVATWRYDRVGAERLSVTVYPFKALPLGVRGRLRQRAREIGRFFGRRKVEFRVETAATAAA